MLNHIPILQGEAHDIIKRLSPNIVSSKNWDIKSSIGMRKITQWITTNDAKYPK